MFFWRNSVTGPRASRASPQPNHKNNLLPTTCGEKDVTKNLNNYLDETSLSFCSSAQYISFYFTLFLLFRHFFSLLFEPGKCILRWRGNKKETRVIFCCLNLYVNSIVSGFTFKWIYIVHQEMRPANWMNPILINLDQSKFYKRKISPNGGYKKRETNPILSLRNGRVAFPHWQKLMDGS